MNLLFFSFTFHFKQIKCACKNDNIQQIYETKIYTFNFGSPCTVPTLGRMDKGNKCVRITVNIQIT